MIMRVFRYIYSWIKAILYFPSTMHMLRLNMEQYKEYSGNNNAYITDIIKNMINKNNSNIIDSIQKIASYNTSNIICNMQRIVNTAFLHRDVFKKYKNIHNGRDLVLVGTGPSVNKYNPFEDAIHIAVNRAILLENIKFDYFFTTHFSHKNYFSEEYDYLQHIESRLHDNLKIFYGILLYDDNYTFNIIPESIALKHNAERFYNTQNRHNTFHGTYQIDSEEIYATGKDIAGTGTISFIAFQFALYTNPKRIYLVGQDTAQTGYFNNLIQPSSDFDALIRGWKELKYFSDIYYPDTEIISINPVGLTGIFRDMQMEE